MSARLTPILTAIAVLILSPGPALAAVCQPPGPVVFDLFNDDTKVGAITADLERDGAETVSVLRIDVDVAFLGATVYRYRHHSRERWRDGRFQAFEGRTDDNGRRRAVRITPQGERYRLIRNEESSEVEALLLSHLMWCPSLLADRPMLSTLNGKTREARIETLGTRRIETSAGVRQARGYRVTQKGKSGEVWYDSGDLLIAAAWPTVIGTTAHIRRRLPPAAAVKSLTHRR